MGAQWPLNVVQCPVTNLSCTVKLGSSQTVLEDKSVSYWGGGHRDRSMEEQRTVRMSVDSGMVVVVFVCLMYIMLVFGLLFYVKNDWCDLLFENMTVRKTKQIC